MDQELNSHLNCIKELFNKKLQGKDQEIQYLKLESSNAQSELNNALQRINQLETKVQKNEKRMQEMARTIQKLAAFKQTVVESLRTGVDDDTNLNEKQKFKDDLPYSNFKTQNGDSLSDISRSSQSLPGSPVQVKREVALKFLDETPSTIREDSVTGGIDGSSFFKEAQTRLTYDEFASLVWNIKAYNAKKQSKSATLDTLSILFSGRNRDLFDMMEKTLFSS